TKKRLIALVWLAVQEVATMNLNETYKQYAGAALAGHLGVSRSTWCEIYAPHWRALKSAVTNLDCSALDSVLYLKQDKAFDDAIS
ncbi:bacteriophage antitermination protein Q, partial [Pantoea sp. M_5]